MITLENDQLVIRFPHISDDAGISIDFQRTLRIPDDGRDHFLPPGLGRFPLRHIEDYALGTLQHRKQRGGVIMPMFQTDALWLNFASLGYGVTKLPVALKIGAGKINAVSGEKWAEGVSENPQSYVVIPGQPWLDGFNVGRGVIRQFIAMPLGQGYTVEEQMDPDSDVGGIQIEAIPMKKDRFDAMRERQRTVILDHSVEAMASYSVAALEMGLGMGGSMQQDIYEDEFGIDAWDLENRQRTFVMLANADQWIQITGEIPPLSPISADDYTKAGLPWFDYYDGDRKAINGAKALGKLKSIKDLSDAKRSNVWPTDGLIDEPTIQSVQKVVASGKW